MMIRSEKGLSGEADQAENNLETESASFSLAQPGRGSHRDSQSGNGANITVEIQSNQCRNNIITAIVQR